MLRYVFFSFRPWLPGAVPPTLETSVLLYRFWYWSVWYLRGCAVSLCCSSFTNRLNNKCYSGKWKKSKKEILCRFSLNLFKAKHQLPPPGADGRWKSRWEGVGVHFHTSTLLENWTGGFYTDTKGWQQKKDRGRRMSTSKGGGGGECWGEKRQETWGRGRRDEEKEGVEMLKVEETRSERRK